MRVESNTQREKLVLPEFGRNVQQMVDHCMSIADREERNRCAAGIVSIMNNLFSDRRDDDNSNKMLWNQLAIMSDFKLDIDYPCEVIRPDDLHSRPDKLPYQLEPIRLRHYGKIVEGLIDIASDMPEGEERDQLLIMIASHMKKQLVAVNREGVDDERIFKDLEMYSRGRIVMTTDRYKLCDFKDVAPVQQSSKKKKRK
ncbi:MAG: DUF4290 domain-containing protein [Candidatus Limisoma sp.]|nr:DUF4290 domain-containing protein [Candidatus Limisoma sp.]